MIKVNDSSETIRIDSSRELISDTPEYLILKKDIVKVINTDKTLSLISNRNNSRSGSNKSGTSNNIQIGQTAEIINFTAENKFFIFGFQGSCTGDTYYELFINGILEASYLTSILNKNAEYKYPSAKFAEVNSVITLKGTNRGTGPIRIDGIIQGEELT